MKRYGIAVAVALLVVVSASVFGASAFTSATVDRNTNLNVVSDDSAILALNGGSSAMVTQESGGELTIDAATSGATGVNGDATFTLGDNSSPTGTYAFSITNNAGASKDVQLSYGGFTDDETNSLQFELYDGSGNHLATVQDTQESYTVAGLGDGSTVYVVVEIKTTNGDLGSTNDLSGTLTVSA